MKRKGKYVNLSEDKSGNLVLTLNKRAARELKKEALSLGYERVFLSVLLEDHLCNSGLEFLRPEQIGALTDSVILTDCATADDHGEIIECPYVWWLPDYQVIDPVDELYENGRVVFTRQEG